MLQMRPTPKGAGLEIAGTCDDFTALYRSLHVITELLDSEKKGFSESDRGLQVMSLAYDLRKALPMSFLRDQRYRPGMDTIPREDPRSFMEVESQWFDIDCGDRLHCFRLWPEVIADIMAIEHCTGPWYAFGRGARKHLDYSIHWAQLVLYRNMVLAAILAATKPARHTSIKRLLCEETANCRFIGIWIEYQTMLFLKKKPEARLDSLHLLVKHLVETSSADFLAVMENARAEAETSGCEISDLGFRYEVPFWSEW